MCVVRLTVFMSCGIWLVSPWRLCGSGGGWLGRAWRGIRHSLTASYITRRSDQQTCTLCNYNTIQILFNMIIELYMQSLSL